jgi:YNFM family putative membrane transporter
LIPFSILSERYGRWNILLTSCALAALVGLLVPMSHSLTELVVLRGLQGFLLAGVSAILMAYVGEEFEPTAVIPAMGICAAGNALGSLIGQMLPAWIVGSTQSWQWALGTLAVLVLVGTAVCAATLPRSRFFVSSTASYAQEAKLFLSHLRNPRLLVIYMLIFCFMGAIISIFNGLPFRVESPPFNISPSVYSSFFLVILVGVITSRVAGVVAGRIGIRSTLLSTVIVMIAGVVLMVIPAVWAMVLGGALIVGGAYAGYTCLTSLSAKIVNKGRAQAFALFLASSFSGSAVIGLIGVEIAVVGGWLGLLSYVGVLLVAGFLLTLAVQQPKSDTD